MSGALIVLLAPLDHKQSDKNQHIKMVKKKKKQKDGKNQIPWSQETLNRENAPATTYLWTSEIWENNYLFIYTTGS